MEAKIYAQRVTPEMRDAVFAEMLHNKAEAGWTDEQRAAEAQRIEETRTVLSKYKSARANTEYRYISTDELGKILKFANMTLKEAYQLIGIELNWASPKVAGMVDKLTMLYGSPTFRTVSDFLQACVPLFYRSPNVIQNANPTTRLAELQVRTSGLKDLAPFYDYLKKLAGDDSLIKVFADKHYRNRATVNYLPDLANYMETSLKWVWQIPKKSGCWTHELPLDNAISNYLLLPNRLRELAEEITDMNLQQAEEKEADTNG